MSGYTKDGWNRYHDYQVFMLENGMVLRLYQEYQEKKVWAITKSILFSFPMVFILIGASLGKRKKKD
jgi:hypothetical protein